MHIHLYRTCKFEWPHPTPQKMLHWKQWFLQQDFREKNLIVCFLLFLSETSETRTSFSGIRKKEQRIKTFNIIFYNWMVAFRLVNTRYMLFFSSNRFIVSLILMWKWALWTICCLRSYNWVFFRHKKFLSIIL